MIESQKPMTLGLTQHQEILLRQNFKLSYHLPYLEYCAQKIPLQGLDVLEIGGCLPASLVIDHLKCKSWTAVEAPSYDQELGEANQFHRNLQEKDRARELCTRYSHHYCNAEDLGENHYNRYDLVFSIACFEHINRLPLALEKMFRYLRPGGNLFTMHSPIWSAYDGHHLPIGIPERFDQKMSHQNYVLKPWGHLLSNRTQTYTDISNRFDKAFAEEVIYNVYNSTHINRYFSEDYYVIFSSSDFRILEYKLSFLRSPAPEVQQILETKFPGYKQFSNNGIYAILQKPITNPAKQLVIF
jgi:hypothetical protein